MSPGICCPHVSQIPRPQIQDRGRSCLKNLAECNARKCYDFVHTYYAQDTVLMLTPFSLTIHSNHMGTATVNVFLLPMLQHRKPFGMPIGVGQSHSQKKWSGCDETHAA